MCDKCKGKGYFGDFPGAPPADAYCAECNGTGQVIKKAKTK